MIGIGVNLALRQYGGAGAAPAWTPASPLTTDGVLPAFWYDASDAATVYEDTALTDPAEADDAVAGIKDKSTNALHLLQATAGNRPAWKAAIQNGLSVLRADGNDYLSKATVSVQRRDPGSTIVCVFKPTAVNAQNIALQIRNNSTSTRTTVSTGAVSGQLRLAAKRLDGDTLQTLDGLAVSAGEWILHVVRIDYANEIAHVYKNGGSPITLSPIGQAGHSSDTASTAISLLSNLGTTGLTGDLGEVVGYESALSIAGLNQLGAYIAAKWGLTWTTVTTDIARLTVISSRQMWVTSGSDDWLGRPHLLDRGDGVWVAVYRSGTAHAAGSRLHIRFSSDQGLTWTAEDTYTNGSAVTGFPILPPVDEMGGCEIAKAANSDLLIIVRDGSGANRNGSWLFRSTTSGAGWTSQGKINADNTLIMGGQIILIGSTLYATFTVDADANGATPYAVHLYKSVDHGVTWTFVAEVIAAATGANESSIVSTGGNNLLVIARSDSEATTYKATSTDLGATWSAPSSIGSLVGVIQRPKLRYVGSRLYLFGRDQLTASDLFTVVWYSDDDGVSWNHQLWLNETTLTDTGYCDMLPRTNGNLYLLTYEGTQNTASIYEYVVDVDL